MVEGIRSNGGPDPVKKTKAEANGAPNDVEIRAAAKNYIKDRLTNLPQAFFNNEDSPLKNEYTAAFTHFINAWTDTKTEFFFYKDKDMGDFLIPSNTQFNASKIGATNQNYIGFSDKISSISKEKLAEHLDFAKVKTKLAQIRDGILKGSIKSTNISTKADQSFREHLLAPRKSK